MPICYSLFSQVGACSAKAVLTSCSFPAQLLLPDLNRGVHAEAIATDLIRATRWKYLCKQAHSAP